MQHGVHEADLELLHGSRAQLPNYGALKLKETVQIEAGQTEGLCVHTSDVNGLAIRMARRQVTPSHTPKPQVQSCTCCPSPCLYPFLAPAAASISNYSNQLVARCKLKLL